MKWWKNLYLQVLVAIVAGAVLGYVKPAWGGNMKPLGDAFINTVKMLIGPIIFCTVVSGLGSMSNLRKLGSVGWKALLYFEVVTSLALVIGLAVGNTVKPGVGVQAGNPNAESVKKITSYSSQAKEQGIVPFLLHIIPDTFVSAFTTKTEDGGVLQVLFLAILAGIALSRLGERAPPIANLIHQITHVFFGIVAIVTRAAPIAAFGAMAYTVSTYGVATLVGLGWLMFCVYLTCIAFVFLVLGAIARIHGFSIIRILKLIKEELFIVLGTSSSESALPLLMQKLEKNGCHESVVGIVVPSGYSFNLDGTCIYLTMAVLFISQAMGKPLSMGQQCYVLFILLLTSKGAAAVTGGGFITLAATLGAIGEVPVAGLALILGVDRFLSEARAITNLIGNTLATLVVSKWEHDFDEKKGTAVLIKQSEEPGPAPAEGPVGE